MVKKATICCQISTVDLYYIVPVKSTVEISKNFVAFSEYMNFICISTFNGTNIKTSRENTVSYKKSKVDFLIIQVPLWKSLSWRQKRLFVIINFEPRCKVLSLSHRSFKRWLKKEKKTNTIFLFAKKNITFPLIFVSWYWDHVLQLCAAMMSWVGRWVELVVY